MKSSARFSIASNCKNGFTLVEMSIALVIIGLLIGGTILGKDLIQTSRLRSVVSNIEKYNSGVSAFENKYNCLPGDCKNATNFFSANQDCAGGTGTHTNITTCNGDGDGLVTLTNPSDPPGANSWLYDETVLFWQQLSIAGFIPGTYTGKMDATSYLIPGTNTPAANLKGSCVAINSSGYVSTDAAQKLPYNDTLTAPFDQGNIFALGNQTTNNGAGSLTNTCVAGLVSLTADFAKSIDDKIDDGRPIAGSVQTLIQLDGGVTNYSENTIPGCTNLNWPIDMYSPYEVAYAVTAYRSACQLFFKAAF